MVWNLWAHGHIINRLEWILKTQKFWENIQCNVYLYKGYWFQPPKKTMSILLHEPTNTMRYYSECQTLKKIYNLELNKGKVIRTRNCLKTVKSWKNGIFSLEKYFKRHESYVLYSESHLNEKLTWSQ